MSDHQHGNRSRVNAARSASSLLVASCVLNSLTFEGRVVAQCATPPSCTTKSCVGGDLDLRLPFREGEQYQVTQGYCPAAPSHNGYEVDFGLPYGTAVVATAAGTVLETGDFADICPNGCPNPGFPCPNKNAGIYVKIEHTGATSSWYSSYAHFSQRVVDVNDPVEAGQVIGYSGNSGYAGGPHLHFHIRNGPDCSDTGFRPTPIDGALVTNGQTVGTSIANFFAPNTYRALGPEIFAVGDVVEVFNGPLSVRYNQNDSANACASQVIASKTNGNRGIIRASSAFCGGYKRWLIEWDDTAHTIGWSAQNWLRRVPPTSFSLRFVYSAIGVPVFDGTLVSWGEHQRYTVDGSVTFDDVPCATYPLSISGLWVADTPYGPFSSCSVAAELFECERGTCDSTNFETVLASTAGGAFNIGDRIEVFNTEGTLGLRAWSELCSGNKINKPDGSRGTIQTSSPSPCGGFDRWKILWDGDSIPRWSAEGDHCAGEYWLRIVNPTNPPAKAMTPTPSHGLTNVSISANLAWANGGGASSYNVYFGTDASPDSGELQGNQSATSFDVGSMNFNTTYYWRIDSVNSVGTTQGDIWSFTTGSSPTGPGVLRVTPPDDFIASGIQGGPFSSTITYVLENIGGDDIRVDYTPSAAEWLHPNDFDRTLDPGESADITISFDDTVNEFSTGTYDATIYFTNQTNGNGNTTRSVSLTVNPVPYPVLEVEPTLFDVVQDPDPNHFDFDVWNGGSNVLNWSLSAPGCWIGNLRPRSGSSTGPTDKENVGFNTWSNHGNCTRICEITVTADGVVGSPAVVTVNQAGLGLGPCDGPVLSLSSTSFEVSSGSGRESFLAWNIGSGESEWTATSDCSWVAVLNPSGTLPTSDDDTINFDYAGNPCATTRYCTITVVATPGTGSPAAVTVTQAAASEGFDSDGDGIWDGCDNCPGTVLGIGVDSNGCPPTLSGDTNRDGDIDWDDFAEHSACFAGPLAQAGPDCFLIDVNDDSHVDLRDYGDFAICFSGSGNPAAGFCGN